MEAVKQSRGRVVGCNGLRAMRCTQGQPLQPTQALPEGCFINTKDGAKGNQIDTIKVNHRYQIQTQAWICNKMENPGTIQ